MQLRYLLLFMGANINAAYLRGYFNLVYWTSITITLRLRNRLSFQSFASSRNASAEEKKSRRVTPAAEGSFTKDIRRFP